MRQPLFALALALVLAFVLACAGAALAQPAGAPPAINAPFRQPDYGAWRARFETEGREVYDRRHAIVEALRLRPGMHVADIGAGTGLFTRLMAERLGEGGRVYAVDVSRAFVLGTVQRARAEGHGNVVGVESTQTDTLLPPASLDLAFICDAYHHFEQPAAMLASLRHALRPGASLVVVDFERVPGASPGWILAHVRAGKAEFRREIEAAGFRFAEEVPLMKENYFLRFTAD